MSYVIKNITGYVLYEAKDATDLRSAVEEAVRAGANLTRANLTGANLTRANLTGANLTRANLTGADLSGANGIDHRRVNPLLMLLDQPGPIRAYKLVTADLKSPIHGQTLTYTIGKTVRAKGDTDASVQCGAGINVATLPWVIANWQPGRRILVVEFTAKDIAAIPLGDGKFRLHRCKVVGEKDLADLGLVA